MALIEVESVTKRYRTVVAVDEVSFAVGRGDVVALLGPNGAGKTSLVRMILGITRPDSGRIAVGGEGAPLSRERIGYLPEERGLYKGMPVDKTLAFFGGLAGLSDKEAKKRAHAWLERLGLGERKSDKLEELSRGNQQRVQFISAVLHEPELVVLDEPFSGLDPLGQDLFIELIAELAEGGTTILMSAHQMKLVERCADRLHLLSRGRLVKSGTLDELRAQSGLGERYRVDVGGAAADRAPDVTAVKEMPGVSSVDFEPREGGARWILTLAPGTAVGPFLSALGGDDIVRAEREVPGLHEIYVQTATEAEEGAA